MHLEALPGLGEHLTGRRPLRFFLAKKHQYDRALASVADRSGTPWVMEARGAAAGVGAPAGAAAGAGVEAGVGVGAR